MTDKIQVADLGDLIKAAAFANEHFGSLIFSTTSTELHCLKWKMLIFLCQEAFLKDQNPSAKILSVTGDHFDVRHLVQSAASFMGLQFAINEHPERDQFLLEFEVLGK